MFSTILLLLLSAHITGLISELLNATVGGSVLIPCSLPGNQSLKWLYWQEGNDVLFDWKDGKRIQQEQQNKYENRSQVFTPGFGSGNISITLDNISPEDDQKTFFAHFKIGNKPSEEHCKFTLQVSAPYQHLDLTVNHTTSSATCRARGGYPAAQVSWKGLNRTTDDQLDLQDAETSSQQDQTEKTFSFTSSVNVTGLKSVTCFVYNPRSNETVNRTMEITTDGNERHHFVIIAPCVLLILIVVGVYLWCKKQRPDPAQPHTQAQAQAQNQDQNQDQDQTQDQDQAQDQDQNQAEDADAAEPAQDPVQEEAADAPDETVSLTGTGAALRHRTRRSEGSAGRDTCEDAAASPEKGNLLEKENGNEDNTSD